MNKWDKTDNRSKAVKLAKTVEKIKTWKTENTVEIFKTVEIVKFIETSKIVETIKTAEWSKWLKPVLMITTFKIVKTTTAHDTVRREAPSQALGRPKAFRFFFTSNSGTVTENCSGNFVFLSV